jgi:hypothetical protein
VDLFRSVEDDFLKFRGREIFSKIICMTLSR